MSKSREASAGQPRINRRTFLQHLSLLAAGGLLAACDVPAEDPHVAPWQPVSTRRILQSPEPQPAAAAETPTPQPNDLEAFLALSAVLTGVDDLNPVLGQVYWQSLQNSSQFEIPVRELVVQAGFLGDAPPPDMAALEQTGIFENEQTRALADKIIEYWYTGIYDLPDGTQAVATFVDALAWKTLTYTKPQTICGAPGFWEKHPQWKDG